MERDKFFTPKEAVDFGLIDTIIDKRLNKKQDSEENKI